MGRRTFCSGQKARFKRSGAILVPGAGCVHEHCIRTNPDYLRKCVYARDWGKCAVCRKLCGLFHNGRHVRDGHLWQADHIIPVIEGGGSCGLENIRTLCTACHRQETKKLARRRAKKQACLSGCFPKTREFI